MFCLNKLILTVFKVFEMSPPFYIMLSIIPHPIMWMIIVDISRKYKIFFILYMISGTQVHDY